MTANVSMANVPGSGTDTNSAPDAGGTSGITGALKSEPAESPTIKLAPSGSALGLSNSSVPLLTDVLPLKVLVPERIKVPDPVLVKPAVPVELLIAPLMVAG